MTIDDDSAAIRRGQSGDIGGLESLMAHHQLSALRLAYLLTGERTQAEDVVQDSFLQVFRSIRRFRLGNPFTPWRHGIVLQPPRGDLALRFDAIFLGTGTSSPRSIAGPWTFPLTIPG